MSIIHTAHFKTRIVGEAEAFNEKMILYTETQQQNPEQSTKNVVEEFNRSLRPGEEAREWVEFVKVDIVEIEEYEEDLDWGLDDEEDDEEDDY